jgi:hypothetical protein
VALLHDQVGLLHAIIADRAYFLGYHVIDQHAGGDEPEFGIGKTSIGWHNAPFRL